LVGEIACAQDLDAGLQFLLAHREKNFFLSVNYLTPVGRFLNDAAEPGRMLAEI
jgi:hypothetical protein